MVQSFCDAFVGPHSTGFNFFIISGIISSTLSLAYVFFIFSVSMQTEDGPVQCTKLSRGQLVNNAAIAIIVILLTPCILIQMSLICAYASYASLPTFLCVGLVTLFINPHSTFTCLKNKHAFKYGFLKVMTNIFIPVSRITRKFNLFRY